MSGGEGVVYVNDVYFGRVGMLFDVIDWYVWVGCERVGFFVTRSFG